MFKKDIMIPAPETPQIPILSQENFAEIAEIIAQKLDAEKAEGVVVYELNNRSNMAYYGVVASGLSARHVSALSDKVVDEVWKKYRYDVTIDGQEGGEWVIVDFSGVILHIFQPLYRQAYDIEGLWHDLNLVKNQRGEVPQLAAETGVIHPVDLLRAKIETDPELLEYREMEELLEND